MKGRYKHFGDHLINLYYEQIYCRLLFTYKHKYTRVNETFFIIGWTNPLRVTVQSHTFAKIPQRKCNCLNRNLHNLYFHIWNIFPFICHIGFKFVELLTCKFTTRKLLGLEVISLVGSTLLHCQTIDNGPTLTMNFTEGSLMRPGLEKRLSNPAPGGPVSGRVLLLSAPNIFAWKFLVIMKILTIWFWCV